MATLPYKRSRSITLTAAVVALGLIAAGCGRSSSLLSQRLVQRPHACGEHRWRSREGDCGRRVRQREDGVRPRSGYGWFGSRLQR